MLSRIHGLKADLSKAETNEESSQVNEVKLLETSLEATEAYHQGLAACMSEEYDQAIEKFQQVLAYPPPHQMKDNAQYWLAECYYAQANYACALDEFQRVKKYFPEAEKVFDAELKIAYTYYRMGQIETVRQKLSLLRQDWPDQKYRSSIDALQEKIQSGQAQ